MRTRVTIALVSEILASGRPGSRAARAHYFEKIDLARLRALDRRWERTYSKIPPKRIDATRGRYSKR